MMMMIMVIILVMESENSLKVTWLWWEKINAVTLNNEVSNKIKFDENVTCDYLSLVVSLYHCISKLDVETRHCIFITCDQNDFGYKLYDSLENKFVKRHDLEFMNDQLIDDVDK
ncbi:hypothetical protein CR513_62438, partial [Mucuna pruriens]